MRPGDGTNVRVIARLDIKGPNLVKGIHFEGLRVLGKPEDFARRYYEEGADELFYMDAVASLYDRNSLLDIIRRTARHMFIPLTVGGGLRTVDDIRTVLRAGADKAALNTAVVKTPELIREAARSFGSSTVVVSIEAMRKPDGFCEAYVDYGRQATGVDAISWAVRAAELGAGEIAVTSIDREGTGRGFDIELIRQVAESVPVPVIAGGGAGTIAHVRDGLVRGKADAVCLASMLHYHVVRTNRYVVGEFESEGNIDFLVRRRKHHQDFSMVMGVSLGEIKDHLISGGLVCRPTGEAT